MTLPPPIPNHHYLPPGLAMPVAEPSGLDAPYWEGTRRERLLVQRCGACGCHQWEPEWVCHRCHALKPGWVEVAPQATVVALERVWHPVVAALAPACPYLLVVVQLTSAPLRMVGNLLGDPQQDPAPGTALHAVFEHHDDAQPPFTLVQWRVADAQHGSQAS